MPPAADHDHDVTGVTIADDSEVAVVAVCEMTDIPVQEDEYDTDSESQGRSGRAIRVHFRLEFVRPSERSGRYSHIHEHLTGHEND